MIAKANALIAVTPYTVTYDGNPHTAVGTASGVEPEPEDLSSLLDFSGTTHAGANIYVGDAWTFAGNINYNATGGSVADVIDKAIATSRSPRTASRTTAILTPPAEWPPASSRPIRLT